MTQPHRTTPAASAACASAREAWFRVFLTGLLFVALILSGSVPQGMMRSAGADGMRLVLCTPDGPRDVWMTPAGDIRDTGSLPGRNHETGKCLAVTLSLAAVQTGVGDLVAPGDPADLRLSLGGPRDMPHLFQAAAHPRGPPRTIPVL